MNAVVLAHVAGLPVEELLSLAVPLTTCAAVGARAAWQHRRAGSGLRRWGRDAARR